MKRIGLFFGGMSNEASVSIASAKNIVKNLDAKKYKLVLIYRHIDGKFYHIQNIGQVSQPQHKRRMNIEDFQKTFDIALLMTHGKYGEDWVLQWILESQKIRYCWCRVASSSLCMDKAVFKTFLQGKDIQQVKFVILDNKKKLADIAKQFSLPVYVKPANSGSSVGITKVDKRSGLFKAIKEASHHDDKILIEQWLVSPREIEVAVLGNDELMISQPWELIKTEDFYSFDEKYRLNKTQVDIPAKLTIAQKNQIRKTAEKIYRICDCRWFARVDFFLSKWKIYINEINTLPGFTDISMFPMLMKNMWLSYKQLINEIIELT